MAISTPMDTEIVWLRLNNRHIVPLSRHTAEDLSSVVTFDVMDEKLTLLHNTDVPTPINLSQKVFQLVGYIIWTNAKISKDRQ